MSNDSCHTKRILLKTAISKPILQVFRVILNNILVCTLILYGTNQYRLKAASNHIRVWQHPSCILDGIDISYSSRVNSYLIRKIIEIFEFLIVEKQSYRIKLQLSLLQSVIQIFLVKQIACTMQRKMLKFSLKDSMNNPYHDCVSRRSKLNMDTLLERFSNWCW